MKLLKTLFLIFISISNLHAKVLLGIDVLQKQNFESLKGKRIGLITNHTGVNRKGKSTIDLLYQAQGVRLIAIFSPEHGVRGTEAHGKQINHSKDSKTGLPVYSLYGSTQRPAPEMLRGLDALVFDIQDIGTRFYTYTTTLAYAMEEAAKNNLEFFVLDRPNPITGAIMEGEVLSPEIRHFTAYLQIPVRHGMTVGEIANWYNQTAKLNLKLHIIKMEGWNRTMWWKDTGLKFRPPSPNIRNWKASLVYPGIGGFEATNLSVGRGTKKPFEIFGAPWMDGEEIAERLNLFAPSGFEFSAVQFKPTEDLYKGQKCQGVRIKITDHYSARPIDLFVYLFMILREKYPEQFVVRWNELERITGSSWFKQMLDMNQSAEAILEMIHTKAGQFQQSAKPYFLY